MTHLDDGEYGSTVAENGNGLSLSPVLPTSANRWPPRPLQIVSLLDVIKFPAANFALIMQNLTLVYTDALKRTGVVSNDDIKLYDRSVIDALDHSKDVGLALSKMSLERLSEALRKGQMTYEEVKAGVNDVLDRMNDETFSQLFIQIPSEVASYYADDPQFGEQAASRFPKITEDIQEAAKCFAVGRYTACVFHLMRVTEFAVQQLGKRLAINLVGEKNWANILDEVDKAIKVLPIKNSHQKAKRNRLAEASAHLRMVKDAWRNDVMHPKETYTEEEAERVFRNVKDFMVHLATKL